MKGAGWGTLQGMERERKTGMEKQGEAVRGGGDSDIWTYMERSVRTANHKAVLIRMVATRKRN